MHLVGQKYGRVLDVLFKSVNGPRGGSQVAHMGDGGGDFHFFDMVAQIRETFSACCSMASATRYFSAAYWAGGTCSQASPNFRVISATWLVPGGEKAGSIKV